ncbi:uncharacterized protein LOC122391860 [Amphibalanus amphitrite]|uniref:uncharacterized protein LOC122391860 n=1 Tax=Amphibalanus amphitrite TaxID=1232801 RepID=UPI001C91094D|nr:uncharacterized protein LOC122391860 [Amphibalanus amphitrite]
MVVREILGIAFVAIICKSAPLKSAPEGKCRAGDSMKRGCNDCFCLAGEWACSLKVCYGPKDFAPVSFLCKAVPFISGCKDKTAPGGAEITTPPPPIQQLESNANSTSSPTAIVFPSPVDSQTPNTGCPPDVDQRPLPPHPGSSGDAAGRGDGEDDSQYDIDIRILQPTNAKPAEGTRAAHRPRRCGQGTVTGTAASTSSAHVSSVGGGPYRDPPAATVTDSRPPSTGDPSKRVRRKDRPRRRRPGAAAGNSHRQHRTGGFPIWWPAW